MNTTFLNEVIARQRLADLERRTRRAQRPDTHSRTTPRRGLVLAFHWQLPRTRFAG